MRLILCLKCDTVINVKEDGSISSCTCGECKAKYKDTKIEYIGNEIVLMGFELTSLVKAISERKETGSSVYFNAYVSAKQTPKFVKVSKI